MLKVVRESHQRTVQDLLNGSSEQTTPFDHPHSMQTQGYFTMPSIGSTSDSAVSNSRLEDDQSDARIESISSSGKQPFVHSDPDDSSDNSSGFPSPPINKGIPRTSRRVADEDDDSGAMDQNSMLDSRHPQSVNDSTAIIERVVRVSRALGNYPRTVPRAATLNAGLKIRYHHILTRPATSGIIRVSLALGRHLAMIGSAISGFVNGGLGPGDDPAMLPLASSATF